MVLRMLLHSFLANHPRLNCWKMSDAHQLPTVELHLRVMVAMLKRAICAETSCMMVLLDIKHWQQASKADNELVKLMYAEAWHNLKPWNVAANHWQNNVDLTPVLSRVPVADVPSQADAAIITFHCT